MTEYIIEKLTGEIRCDYIGSGNYTQFLFKIDKNGNVDITTQSICSGFGTQTKGKINKELNINDNIQIPNYLIEVIKKLLNPQNTDIYTSYYQNAIQVIKQLKISLKEHLNNTDYITDIETKLNITTNKNIIFETQIKEIEQKVKNIETLYFDTLKDNEKLKEEIVLLHHLIFKTPILILIIN